MHTHQPTRRNAMGAAINMAATIAAGASLTNISFSGAGMAADGPSGFLTLTSGAAQLSFSPRHGGRVCGVHLADLANMIKFDARLDQVAHAVSVTADDVPIFGRSIWVSPQADWWKSQSLNAARDGAAWPPDPWLTIGATELVAGQSEGAILVHGAPSALSGVRVDQKIEALAPQGDFGAFRLTTNASNISDISRFWGLWSNSRFARGALGFVPLADLADAPATAFEGPFYAPVVTEKEGLGTIGFLDISDNPLCRPDFQGKVFANPNHAYFGVLHQGQCLLIAFEKVAANEIAEGQGQVEFYINDPNNAAEGLLEAEHHGPRAHIAPGAAIDMIEHWVIFPHAGGVDGALTEKISQALAAYQLG